MRPTPSTLNAIMEFDHVITVCHDGTVTDGPPGVYAPSLLDGDISDSCWRLLNGWSGQYRYSGPVMHNSEYIGGRMAEHILNTPGVYVAIVSDYTPEEEDGELITEGWAVARLCGHSWMSGAAYVHPEDLDTAHMLLLGTGQHIVCQRCGTRWRPGDYTGEMS